MIQAMSLCKVCVHGEMLYAQRGEEVVTLCPAVNFDAVYSICWHCSYYRLHPAIQD